MKLQKRGATGGKISGAGGGGLDLYAREMQSIPSCKSWKNLELQQELSICRTRIENLDCIGRP